MLVYIILLIYIVGLVYIIGLFVGLLGFRSNLLVLHILSIYRQLHVLNITLNIITLSPFLLIFSLCLLSLFSSFLSLFSLHSLPLLSVYSPSSYSQHGIRATFLWPSLGKIRCSSAATGSRSLPRDLKLSRRFCLPRNPHLQVSVCLKTTFIG